MTWLYVPGICSPSATDTEAPSSPSDPWHGYEPWLVLSGTPTQRPSSWREWKNRGWIERLCGMTCAPSMVQRGVDEWISSLPVSPANPSPQPGNERELTMIAGSGQTSAGSSLTWDPNGCCWKTSRSLFDMDYQKSSTTLPRSGSMRSGACSTRQPLVPRTSDGDSGSWPTPTGEDSRSSGGNPNTTGSHGVTLTDATVARDDQKSPESHLAMKARMGGGRTQATSLNVQSKMWSSPKAQDSKNPPSAERSAERSAARSLPLREQVNLWPTPRVSMNENRTTKHAPSHGVTHGRTLAGEASHQAPTTETDGNGGSQRADLNPSFVAALMGLPWDWLTVSISAATDSSPNAQPKHGASSHGAEDGNCE